MNARSTLLLFMALLLCAPAQAYAHYKVHLSAIEYFAVFSDGAPFKGSVAVEESHQILEQVCSGGGCLPLWQWVLVPREDDKIYELDGKGRAILPALDMSAIFARNPEVMVSLRFIELPEYGLKCDVRDIAPDTEGTWAFEPPIPSEYSSAPMTDSIVVSRDWKDVPASVRLVFPWTRAQAVDYFKEHLSWCN